jgi:hypothetical protein
MYVHNLLEIGTQGRLNPPGYMEIVFLEKGSNLFVAGVDDPNVAPPQVQDFVLQDPGQVHDLFVAVVDLICT